MSDNAFLLGGTIIDGFPLALAMIPDHFLGMIDPFGDFYPSRARLGALKMVLACPDPVGFVQFRDPVFKTLVPGVGDKPIAL